MRFSPRIALLNSWALSPQSGSGTARGVLGLFEGLKRLGVKVDLWTPGDGFKRLPPRFLWNLFLSIPDSYDWVLGVDLDGLFLPPGRYHYGVLIKGVALDEAGYETLLPKIKLALSGYLEAGNIYRAQRIVAPSAYSARRLSELYGIPLSRVAIVPEGIDVIRFPDPGRKPVTRDVVILSVAHQYPRKNTRMILEVFARLRLRFPQVRLKIAGGGPELSNLRSQAIRLGISDRVEFLGSVSDEELLRLYGEATLFILPTLQEGFGIVFLEAMASGLPVVALKRGAVPEVVPHGKAGFLVEDLPGLEDAVGTFLDNPQLIRKMGKFARAYARRFSLENSAALLLEVLNHS